MRERFGSDFGSIYWAALDLGFIGVVGGRIGVHRGPVRYVWGSVWGRSGVDPGSIWVCFGVGYGAIWGWCGVQFGGDVAVELASIGLARAAITSEERTPAKTQPTSGAAICAWYSVLAAKCFSGLHFTTWHDGRNQLGYWQTWAAAAFFVATSVASLAMTRAVRDVDRRDVLR